MTMVLVQRMLIYVVLMLSWTVLLYTAKGPVFTRQPSNTFVIKNGMAELMCEATGIEPLKYKWYHNGKLVESFARKRILRNGHLYIKRVIHKKRKRYSDTGRYYCTVTDNNGQISTSRIVNLTIGYIRKDFREEPQSQVVALGGQLVLSCRSPRSKPKAKIGWLKNNQELFNVNERVSFKNNKQVLTIKNVKKADEGNYQCEAVNVAGRRLSKIAVVRTTVPPTILSISKEKTINIRLQSQTTLTCVASGIPKPKIIWKKLGNNTILPSFNGTLKLTKLKSNDAGNYQCIAFNKVRNVSANVHLILQYVPEFKFISSNVNAVEGSNFTLKCLARSEPYPTVLWYKGKTKFVPDIIYGNKQAKLVNGSIQLSFKPLSLSDTGNYSCRASNKIGSNSRLVSVYVHGKSEFPAFIKTPNRHVIADINEDVNIVCDVRGNPKPAVKWEKDGKDDFINDADVMLREEMLSKIYRHILTITKVRKRNGGIFRCVASNTISTVSKYMTLQVTRKLHLRESVKIGSPRKPNNVTVVEFNDNSARITWKKSKDPVMVYAVGYVNIDKKNDEVIVADNISPNTQQYVVTNLLPNTRYMFFVRGFNGKGYGKPSLLSYEIKTSSSLPTNPVLVPEKIPLPILKINVTSGIAGQLYVRWAPIKENVKIDGFYIYWQAESLPFQNETLQNVRSSGYMISDLQNSTKYSVYVKVFNKADEGPVSETIEQWTSSEPVKLQMGIIQNDTDSIKVTWKRLWKKMSGNDTLKTYIIFYSSTSDKGNDRRKRNVFGVITIPAFPEHYYHVIGDLHPGEKYKVFMRVTTRLGRTYFSHAKSVLLQSPVALSEKSTWQQIKEFVIRPWFLGIAGGCILLVFVLIMLCCLCKRSSNKKDVSCHELQNMNHPNSVRKPESERRDNESDVLSESCHLRRESFSECVDDNATSTCVVYNFNNGSPKSTPHNLDFSGISVAPNKYERMYCSQDSRENESVDFSNRSIPKYSKNDNPTVQRNERSRNPYSPAPRPSCLNIDAIRECDNVQSERKRGKSPTNNLSYPSDAPPDYETAIAENDLDRGAIKETQNTHDRFVAYKQDRFCDKRQSSCSPGSEVSNTCSSIAGRRKGLKPPPKLTIASVNWADMLPPPPSHPPPSSVATRSPPPSPTGTSMCSETTYGRSHASSFRPRRSGSVLSGDVTSDVEKAESVRSGKSKGKSENKLPFDLAGITSDIIMQWADSVTNTSGSGEDSPCSSPDRKSGISSDGSFLTDTDFANAVKAAAECGGFNIDIDLNMYKAVDPISFQPFAGSLSTYNPESNTSMRLSGKKPHKDGDLMRDSSRGRRSRNETRDHKLPSVTEKPSSRCEMNVAVKQRNVRDMSNYGNTCYVPALTRTSALGKSEPVKKKYAVVKKLPQVDPDYPPCNYPSNSLSSSTSNASTVRSSSCPAVVLSDEDNEDII